MSNGNPGSYHQPSGSYHQPPGNNYNQSYGHQPVYGPPGPYYPPPQLTFELRSRLVDYFASAGPAKREQESLLRLLMEQQERIDHQHKLIELLMEQYVPERERANIYNQARRGPPRGASYTAGSPSVWDWLASKIFGATRGIAAPSPPQSAPPPPPPPPPPSVNYSIAKTDADELVGNAIGLVQNACRDALVLNRTPMGESRVVFFGWRLSNRFVDDVLEIERQLQHVDVAASVVVLILVTKGFTCTTKDAREHIHPAQRHIAVAIQLDAGPTRIADNDASNVAAISDVAQFVRSVLN